MIFSNHTLAIKSNKIVCCTCQQAVNIASISLLVLAWLGLAGVSFHWINLFKRFSIVWLPFFLVSDLCSLSIDSWEWTSLESNVLLKLLHSCKSKLLNFSSENIVIFSWVQNAICAWYLFVHRLVGDWFIEFVVDGPGQAIVRWNDAANQMEQLKPNQPVWVYGDSESMGKISK